MTAAATPHPEPSRVRLEGLGPADDPQAGDRSLGADAVVFDLDGVLVDSERCWLEAERRGVEELGGRWGAARADELFGTAPEAATRALASRVGLTGREVELGHAVYRAALEVFAAEVIVMPGAAEVVRHLAERVPVAVATNAPAAIARISLDVAGLHDRLTALVTVDDVEAGKPDPAVYLRAVDLLGVEPARALAVDDSPAGLTAAVAAGLRTVAFGRPPRVPDGVVAAVGSWSQVTVRSR